MSTIAAAPAAVRHTLVDDVAGIVTGAFLASVGLFLLDAGGAVTGGTAGLALLAGRLTGWSFAILYVAATAPFVVLAVARKGWWFAVRSAIAVGLLAVFSLAHPHVLTVARIDPVYAVLAGNLAVGVGLLVLFRHHASLGGFNVVALVCQDRLGWRAGYVQLVLDAATILLGLLVAPAHTVLLSAAGAVVLNLVIALNHRPGRYTGA
ncbi:YitT family protein [Dactylosporangium sp. NPDC000244]|uniref:YitT family protein n=1 Tax=Dactylosporangium sp. NPDC000244 TaxID=3154365 RepID=UPI00331C16D6